MGILDRPDNDAAEHAFTTALADGTTWTRPADQRYVYSIDAGVLTAAPIDAAGKRLSGARHYSPAGWSGLVEHDRTTVTPVHPPVPGFRS